MLTELTYQTDVIDGICQRCQEHVCWLGFSPTCIAQKGSLVSRHFPCSSATQSFKTVQLVLSTQSCENILQEIKREENNSRGGALWFGYEAGRKHTSMAVKLHFFFSHTIWSICHCHAGGSCCAWWHVLCSVLPVCILGDPIFLPSTMLYGSVLLWTHLYELWSMLRSLPSQQNPSKFWSRKCCTRKLQTNSSVTISLGSETH